MAKHLLKDAACKSAATRRGAYRVRDGGGLYLQIRPGGAKYWQYRYQHGGRERLMQLGIYPTMSLKQARAELEHHKAVLAMGRDPITARQVAKSTQITQTAETFSAVADEWLEHNRSRWSAEHYTRNTSLLRLILLPHIGTLPMREIEVSTLLSALRKAEARGTVESARRARAVASRVFAYAISTGRAQSNPATILAGAMKAPQTKHFAALQINDVGPLLNALDSGNLSPVTAEALRLMLYTGLRDFSLRGARWREIDLDKGVWTVPASHMKRREEHSVPLPRQACEALRGLAKITHRGPDSYVFASDKAKAGFLAENTLCLALHRLGFKVTAHGLRSTLMDALTDAGFRVDAIQRQLHHKGTDKVLSAYQRTDFWDYRASMMTYWCDWCDALKEQREAPAITEKVVRLRAA